MSAQHRSAGAIRGAQRSAVRQTRQDALRALLAAGVDPRATDDLRAALGGLSARQLRADLRACGVEGMTLAERTAKGGRAKAAANAGRKES